jgi:hypothetical protein
MEHASTLRHHLAVKGSGGPSDIAARPRLILTGWDQGTANASSETYLTQHGELGRF